MTVFLYTGTPGSGKSLHMAEQIYFRVRSKKPVIANFEIATDRVKHAVDLFAYVDNEQLTPQLLTDFARAYWADKPVKEGGIQLYIDECGVVFNPRDWNAPMRKQWVKFFTQHRKLGYDVYLVAQTDGMVDKQIRALVEYEVKHRKVNNFGWVGRLFNIVAFGKPVICAVTYWYGMKQRLSADFYIGLKRFYTIYDTMRLFDAQA